MSTDGKTHVYVTSTDVKNRDTKHYYVESCDSIDVADQVVEHINNRCPAADYAFASDNDVGVKSFPKYDRSRLTEKGKHDPIIRRSIDPREVV